jgi:hypothetical protein
MAAALRANLPPMPRFLIHHRHEPLQCGVVFAAFMGQESPASPSRDARLVCIWGPRHLVVGGGGQRGRGARAVAVLRGGALDRDPGGRGRHSVREDEP